MKVNADSTTSVQRTANCLRPFLDLSYIVFTVYGQNGVLGKNRGEGGKDNQKRPEEGRWESKHV